MGLKIQLTNSMVRNKSQQDLLTIAGYIKT